MLRICKGVGMLAALAWLSSASTPVATVSCTEPFSLDERLIAAPGITSWPLMVGDDVETGIAPAMIVFLDGSSVKLAARSRIRLAATDSQLKVILEDGTLDYKVAGDSKLSVSSLKTQNQHGQPTALKVSYLSGAAVESGKAPPTSHSEPPRAKNSTHSLLDGLPVLGNFP